MEGNSMKLRSICVFCGSSAGNDPAYMSVAYALGKDIAEKNLKLVYGGGRTGLMGAVAGACLEAGGCVEGVIPEALFNDNLSQDALTKLHVVGNMHERKALMAELSDAFIALPGGFGTFEEFFEVLTWAQLGIHMKPCGLLNVAGFYDGLLAFLDHAAGQGFIYTPHRQLILTGKNPAELVGILIDADPVRQNKADWLRRMSETP